MFHFELVRLEFGDPFSIFGVSCLMGFLIIPPSNIRNIVTAFLDKDTPLPFSIFIRDGNLQIRRGTISQQLRNLVQMSSTNEGALMI